MPMPSLKERALAMHRRRLAESEAALFADLEEIKRGLHELKQQVPGTPEYASRKRAEVASRAAVAALRRKTDPLLKTMRKLLKLINER